MPITGLQLNSLHLTRQQQQPTILTCGSMLECCSSRLETNSSVVVVLTWRVLHIQALDKPSNNVGLRCRFIQYISRNKCHC